MEENNPRFLPRIQAVAAGATTRTTGARLRLNLDLKAWHERLKDCIEQEVEQRRLFPWTAVFFGLGIVAFFQAEGRPALWPPMLGLALCTAVAIRLRGDLWGLAAAIAAAAMFAGFAAGVVRTRQVEAPVLARLTIAPLTGFIEEIEERPTGARVTLRVYELDGSTPRDRPRRVRVSVRDAKALKPGQFVAATARLLPPPEAAWPGGYDFARDAYFRGIGAVGSIVGQVTSSAPPQPPPWDLALSARIDEARNALARRIADAIGGPPGAVAAALVTGKRGFIDEATNDVLRAAGIYHIVSISGLHMVLAAGTFFWLARALLTLSPGIALYWPVKKIAAVAAMGGATAYCIFSGSEVATERSLIMTLVMFGAILVDRPALSLRNLAIAALIVLAREPETLLGPSFQMSFGAVAALIALSERLRSSPAGEFGSGFVGWMMHGARRSAIGLLAVTFVASLATAPFGAYHFHTLNPLGLIGNGLALPLVSLVVMPAAVLGTLAYALGLDRPVWAIMGEAVDWVLTASTWVSELQGSSVVVPAFSAGALALFAAALVLAAFAASALRWAAIVPAGLALTLALTPERPDLYIDRSGAGAAVRSGGGSLALVGRPSAFVAEQWLRADGDGRPADDPSLRTPARCDRLGCVVMLPDGRSVSFVQESLAFEEDCGRATVLVSRLTAPAGCRASLVLDRRALQAGGALDVRIDGTTFAVRTGRQSSVPRPWERRGTQPSAQPRIPAIAPVPADPDGEPEADLSSDERG